MSLTINEIRDYYYYHYTYKLMGQKRKTKKKWKEVLESDMIAKYLQRLDGQDRTI